MFGSGSKWLDPTGLGLGGRLRGSRVEGFRVSGSGSGLYCLKRLNAVSRFNLLFDGDCAISVTQGLQGRICANCSNSFLAKLPSKKPVLFLSESLAPQTRK